MVKLLGSIALYYYGILDAFSFGMLSKYLGKKAEEHNKKVKEIAENHSRLKAELEEKQQNRLNSYEFKLWTSNNLRFKVTYSNNRYIKYQIQTWKLQLQAFNQ